VTSGEQPAGESMDNETREQFRALRKDNQIVRQEVREDLGGLHRKIDEHIGAINSRCARRGEELAVLTNLERERNRRVDRRVALGLLIIAAVTLLLNLLP
jgi:hypothetical protein